MGRKGKVVVGSFLVTVALTTLTAACSGPGDTLQPAGPGASRIDWLWWAMFAISAFVFLVVIGLLGHGLFRRREAPDDSPVPDDGRGVRSVLLGGVAFPIVVLIILFIVTLVALEAQAREDAGSHSFTVDVTARQWWWELSYPDQGFTTANELHIPTGVPIQVNVTSTDVIHSLWVPRLQRKVDAIPGRTNTVTLQADTAGTYLGVCAEYCGLQHAHMQFEVVAQSPTDFQAWLSDQQATPAQPSGGLLLQGQQILLGSSCTYCHTIRGTNASGTVGPDLTHVASRGTLAAGSIPNTPAELRQWISDPQSIKPGTQMPATAFTPKEMDELIAYIESLH
jgi:cytochrome c oxidase subunit II